MNAPSPSPRTIAAAFLERARTTPDRVAYARKRLGLWEETTWAGYADEVRRAAAALQGQGLRRGDVVALLGDARPELATIVLAGQLLGLRCASLYPATGPTELAALLADLDPRLVVGEDDEDVAKLAEAGVAAAATVVLEPRGGSRGDATPWAELLDRAEDGPADGPDLAALAAAVAPDDVAHVALTSGTADGARAVPVSHANVVAAWEGALAVLPTIDHRDRIVVDAPLAHPAGQAGGLVLPVLTGCTAFFVEDPVEAVVAAVEVRPTVALGTPRRWLRLWRQVRTGIEGSSRLKRALLTASTGLRRGPAGVLARAVQLPLLRKVGASRLRVCVVGWAAVPEGLVEFWASLGIEMRELYGLAETAGVVAIGAAGVTEPGLLGTAVAGAELDLAPDGELLVRGPQVSLGTDGDGWLRTHDVARRADDGSLVLAGRRDGVLDLGDGVAVHAEAVERALRTSPHVSEAIAYVGARAELEAVVELDLASVATWARAHEVVFTAPDELPGREEVRELVGEEVDRVSAALRGRGLPSIRRIDILPAPLTLAELTPTRRVRGAHRRSLAEAGVGAGLATALSEG